jgi:transcription antitermination factor NusG
MFTSNHEWYALRVRPQCEKQVSMALHGKGYDEFLPTYRSRRRWSDRFKDIELPLFPGYVFSRFNVHKRLPVLTTPGVLHIVGIGPSPAPVAESEIEALQAVAASGLQACPWPFLEVGQRVRLEEGPLRGLHGVLEQVDDANRLVVSVTLLRRSVAVQIDRRWVRPVQGATCGGARSGGSRTENARRQAAGDAG